MTDTELTFEHSISALPQQREKLLVSYCNMLAIGMDDIEHLTDRLVDFNQRLTDYSALGQFALADVVGQRTRTSSAADSEATRQLAELEKLTDQYLSFVDRYQTPGKPRDLQELCADFEQLGESLADRFEIEDNLLKQYAV